MGVIKWQWNAVLREGEVGETIQNPSVNEILTVISFYEVYTIFLVLFKVRVKQNENIHFNDFLQG